MPHVNICLVNEHNVECDCLDGIVFEKRINAIDGVQRRGSDVGEHLVVEERGEHERQKEPAAQRNAVISRDALGGQILL